MALRKKNTARLANLNKTKKVDYRQAHKKSIAVLVVLESRAQASNEARARVRAVVISRLDMYRMPRL